MSRILCLTAAFLAMALLPNIPPARGAAQLSRQKHILPDGQRWAVVVGISRYKNLPATEQLKFADRDAQSFASFLHSAEGGSVPSDNIRLLINEQATDRNVRSALGSWLPANVSQRDVVYFYFAGHGVVEDGQGGAYLITYDAAPDDLYATAVSVESIQLLLQKRIKARQVIVLADACRTSRIGVGSVRNWDKNSIHQNLEDLARVRSGIYTLVASRPGEFSQEDERWGGGHGVFTFYLIEALKGLANSDGDRFVRGEEAFRFLSVRVPEATSGSQHPSQSGRVGAQIAMAVVAEPQRASIASVSRQQSLSKAPQPPPPRTPPGAGTTFPTGGRAKGSEPVSSTSDRAKAATATAQESAESQGLPVRNEGPAGPSQPGGRKALSAEPGQAEGQKAPSVAGGAVKDDRPNQPTVSEMRRDSRVSIGRPGEGEAVKMPGRNEPVGSRSDPTGGKKEEPKRKKANEVALASPLPNASRAPSALPVINFPAPPPPAPPVSPLTAGLEAAISAESLLEPKGRSAWDYYLQLVKGNPDRPELAPFKEKLSKALEQGGQRAIDKYTQNGMVELEEIQKAVQLLSKAAQLRPDDRQLKARQLFLSGREMIMRRWYEDAEAELKKAAALDPKSAHILEALGLAYHHQRKFFLAERAFKQAIDLAPDWFLPYYDLALTYEEGRSYEDAITQYQEAIKRNPQQAASYLRLAALLIDRKRFDGAAQLLEKAVEFVPTNPDIYARLGDAYFGLGRHQDASKAHRRARELSVIK